MRSRWPESAARCMTGVDEICVIGGGEIYAQALPLADRLHITHVLGKGRRRHGFSADRP